MSRIVCALLHRYFNEYTTSCIADLYTLPTCDSITYTVMSMYTGLACCIEAGSISVTGSVWQRALLQ
jgi:hypothetical protein